MGKRVSKVESASATRERHLTIIYFVEAKKTRTIKIPLDRLKFVVLALGAFVFWAVASVIIVSHLLSENTLLSRRLHAALATVFDYETRYDKVYDIAYPERPTTEQSPDLVETSDGPTASGTDRQPLHANGKTNKMTDANKNGLASKVGEHRSSEKLGQVVETASAPSAPRQKPNRSAGVEAPSNGQAKAPEAVEETLHVDITGRASLNANNSALNVIFAVRNLAGGGKAEGKVMAVGRYLTNAGGTLYVAEPEGIRVNSAGEVINQRHGDRFSIRHFKQYQLRFPMPHEPGRYTTIHVVLTPYTGKPVTYDVEVAAPRILPSPTPSPSPITPKSEDVGDEDSEPSADANVPSR